MTIHSMPPVAPQAGTSGAPTTVRTADEQQAHTQRKAQKKQRKLDRLLFFLGWCEGCRSYGGSF